MSVTVLVPTRNRPEYLTTVLESIRKQTAVSQIEKIIVSENGTIDESLVICKKFKDLPITYVKQQNPFSTNVLHFEWLINQSESLYTAMIHDDDWWYPTHIETALKSLKETNSVGYFSNFVYSKNEILNGAFFHHTSVISFLCGDKSAFETILLSISDVATLCYLYTPFHMSAMVVNTSSLKRTNIESIKDSKPWYVDRILYPFLCADGNVVFNPQVLCGVREHERNYAKMVNDEERILSHKEGSEKINRLAISKGVDILENWRKIKDRIDPTDWAEVVFMYEFYYGKNENSLFSSPSPKLDKPSFLKRVIRKILS